MTKRDSQTPLDLSSGYLLIASELFLGHAPRDAGLAGFTLGLGQLLAMPERGHCEKVRNSGQHRIARAFESERDHLVAFVRPWNECDDERASVVFEASRRRA